MEQMSCLAKGFQKKCGAWGEAQAAVLLEGKGFQVMHRNWRHAHEEIDLIAQDREMVVFVEVRVRRNRALVPGFESLTKRKRGALKRAALAFLEQYPEVQFYRWDVVEYRIADAQYRHYDAMHYENALTME
jgi:putative endonuclease